MSLDINNVIIVSCELEQCYLCFTDGGIEVNGGKWNEVNNCSRLQAVAPCSTHEGCRMQTDSQSALGCQQALDDANSCAVTGAGKQGWGALCREESGDKTCFERTETAGWGIRCVACSSTTPRGQKGLEGTRILQVSFVLAALETRHENQGYRYICLSIFSMGVQEGGEASEEN